jgi:hypothetical protein
MDKQIIEKILNESINAPSGSNSQPWEFIVKNDGIYLKYLPEKDHPVLNFNNRGTLIACGALAENISIVANHYGYSTQITLLEDKSNKIIAKFSFFQATNSSDKELYEVIPLRASNRKQFKKEPLNQEEKDYLFKEVNKFSDFKVAYLEDQNKINAVAKYLSYDIILNFKNETLRKIFFKELLFDDNLAKQGYEGLYVKTLELKPPQIFVMKLLRNDNVFKIFNKIGFINAIYKDVVKMNSSAGLLGSILTPNNDFSFFHLGRLLENIWLRATKLNLGFHLITGILFFWQQVNFGNKEIFNQEEIDLINNSHQKIRELFGFETNNKIIGVVFRIGKSDRPSAFSVKKPPIIKFE